MGWSHTLTHVLSEREEDSQPTLIAGPRPVRAPLLRASPVPPLHIWGHSSVLCTKTPNSTPRDAQGKGVSPCECLGV